MQDVVRVERDGELAVAHCRGEIDIAVEESFRQGLLALSAPGVRAAVVDLSDVTFMDCSGINLVLAAGRRCAQEGVPIVLAAVPPALQRVLTLLGVRDIFVIMECVPDAAFLARTWAETALRFGETGNVVRPPAVGRPAGGRGG
jgi:anti-anti-sigma factor